MTEQVRLSERSELTDGKRVFVLTGEVNAHGLRRADVVRVTEAGREEGWLPGCRVWLTPEWTEMLELAGEGRADTQAPSPASAGAESEPTLETPNRGRFEA